MGLYKCKMCGGELHIEEGMKVVECEYCGTSQTISSSNDEKILKLYARGNLLRTQNEFDKAYNIFEQIVVENPSDAEAYWNLLLCKYGITYVDDYDGSKKPTINRMSMISIKEDEDYKKVIDNADVVTREIYKSQTEEISKIQEDILSIVKKEKPYDIFISYKETDEYGDRTEDSVLAQEIYDSLTKEGYKVFLSRVTLANAIGSEYEPYIYSALYSSKIMVLVTTREEYVNAVWVKNEWSRFLKMMKEDSSKKIIPCFKSIDPYDLPKEIRNIQSVNFDKLGAIQDLIIGVNKILGKKQKKDESIEVNNSPFASLYKRLDELVSNSNFSDAQKVLEQLILFEPNNGVLYLYKLMIKYSFPTIQVAINGYNKYITSDLYLNLSKYNNDDNPKINKFINDVENYIYKIAKDLKEKNLYEDAIKNFEFIKSFKDSETKIEECYNDIYNEACNLMDNDLYEKALDKLKFVSDYLDVKDILNECEKLKKYKLIYHEALLKINQLMEEDNNSFKPYLVEEQVERIEKINYKNSKELARDFRSQLKERKEKIKQEVTERLNRQLAEEAEKRRKNKKRNIIILSISSFCIAVFCLINFLFIPLSKYMNAMEYANNKQYDQALNILEYLDFSDSKNQSQLIKAAKYIERGDYNSAIKYVTSINGTVEIKYDLNGGKSNVTSETITSNNKIKNTALKEGYDFKDWTITNYKLNSKEYILMLDLKASFDTVDYNLDLILDGGSVEGDIPSKYNIESKDIHISNPSKKGYTFLGWSDGIDNELIKDLVIETGNVGNKEYTAMWQANTYTVSYYLEDELLYEDKVVYDTNYEYRKRFVTDDEETLINWKNDTMEINPGYKGTFEYDHDVKLYAVVGYVSNEFTYSVNKNIVTITGYNGYMTSIRIPSYILENGVYYKVNTIGSNAFENCRNLTSIVIPEGVTSIGSSAFYECSSLTSIVIPESVTSIGYGAFYNCSSLTIYCEASSQPSGWNSYWNSSNRPVYWGINESTYIEIEGIEYVIVDGEAVVSRYVGNNTEVIIPSTIEIKGTTYNVTTIGDFAFRGCSSLTSIVIPESVTSIGSSAFSGCSSLTIIVIPESVTSIGSSTFSGCSSLTSMVIPEEVTSIGNDAFNGCSSLTSITLPNSLTSIGSFVFYRCNSLENVYYKGTIEEWCNLEFDSISCPMYYAENFYMLNENNEWYKPTEILIPESITTIGNYQFEGFSQFTSITLPNSLTSIGSSAFYKCSSLTSITLPNSLTSIGYGAFLYCSSLTSMVIPEGVTSIGDDAFNGCSSLTSITLPNSLTSIGQYAFSGCRSLTSITLANSLTSIGNHAFYDCDSLTSIVIPEGVTSIGSYAFYECSRLTSIEIPEGVTSIGIYAFLGCFSLTIYCEENSQPSGWHSNWNPSGSPVYWGINESNYIEIEGIKYVIIDGEAVVSRYVGNNTEVIIPSSIEINGTTYNVTSIGNDAFNGCSSLTSITLPNSLTSIGSYAFYNCSSLTSITLPESVTSIGYSAFYGCKSLTIYCEASSKPSGWDSNWNYSRPVYWGYGK